MVLSGVFGDDLLKRGGVGLDGAIEIIRGSRYSGSLENVSIDAWTNALAIGSLGRFAVGLGLKAVGAAGRAAVPKAAISGKTAAEIAAATSFVLKKERNALACEAGELLRRLTQEELDKLAANMKLAERVLSPSEIASATNPRVARMHFGKALERSVGDRIEKNATLRAVFDYKGRFPGPDILGIGRYDGLIFDITTPGQVIVHFRKYGDELVVLTYTRPTGFP